MAQGKAGGCCWHTWHRFCISVHSFYYNAFGRLGHLIGGHPFISMLIAFLIAAPLSLGMMKFSMETRSELLFTPLGSRSADDLAKASVYFTFKSRVEEIILLSKTSTNCLKEDIITFSLELFTKVMKLEDTESLCLKSPVINQQNMTTCLSINFLECFMFSRARIRNVTETLNYYHKNDLTMSNGKSARTNFVQLFGGLSFNTSGIKSAQALRIAILMRQPDDIDELNKVLEWEERFLKLLETEGNRADTLDIELHYYAGRSLDDSVSASALSDIKLVVVSITLMILFCIFTLSSFVKQRISHTFLSQAGIFAIMLGISSSFGFILLCGVPFIGLVGILPFLVLGVGIDDMFILINALDRLPASNVGRERVKRVLSSVGASITMTTVTDFVAFAVSTATGFLGIRYFCTYAALATIVVYIMIVTFFVGFMHIDVRRIETKRRDALQCFKSSDTVDDPWNTKRHNVFSKIMNMLGKLLMKKVTKVIVGCLAASLLSAGLYGTYYLDQSFDASSLGRDGSYQKKFWNIKRKYYSQETEVSVVTIGKYNYENENFQTRYRDLSNIIRKNKYYQNYSQNWMESFLMWTNKHAINNSGRLFFKNLRRFLNTKEFFYFNSDIVFSNDNQSISASRVIAKVQSTTSSVFRKDAMLSLRKELDSNKYISAFPITYVFVYFEQFAIILTDTIKNLSLSAVAVIIVTAPYLVFPSAILLVFLQFLCLVIELLGLMYAWNVSLNSISMIVIIMAIGFSVDYSAHIAHAYVHNSNGSPNERAIQALSEVGSSVVMGGFTTFLGMLVTAFASSEVFRIFFKMVFGIVVLGLIHGLIFLPVFLSVFCKSKLNNEKEAEQKIEERKSPTLSSKSAPLENNNKIFPIDEETQKSTSNEQDSSMPST